MWPLAVLVAAAAAIAIGVSLIDAPPVVQPAQPEVGISHAIPPSVGISQVTEATTYPVGLENPGAYEVPVETREGGTFTPTIGPRPVMTADTVCVQCR
jgi:hypothetical protein